MNLRPVLALAAVVLLIAAAPANARGGGRGFGGGFGRGFGGGFSQGGGGGQSFSRGAGTYGVGLQGGGAIGAGAFSWDQKYAEDPYVKAASEEEGRVLKKLNSICRGC